MVVFSSSFLCSVSLPSFNLFLSHSFRIKGRRKKNKKRIQSDLLCLAKKTFYQASVRECEYVGACINVCVNSLDSLLSLSLSFHIISPAVNWSRFFSFTLDCCGCPCAFLFLNISVVRSCAIFSTTLLPFHKYIHIY